jgi:hypothetical protein
MLSKRRDCHPESVLSEIEGLTKNLKFRRLREILWSPDTSGSLERHVAGFFDTLSLGGIGYSTAK